MKETDLFEPVKRWLEERDFTVYSEVQFGKRADVVGRCGNILIVVELKTSLSLDLMEQCDYWRKYAHYVYAAVPHQKRDINHYALKLLRQNRIGLLTVKHCPATWHNPEATLSVNVKQKPMLNRRVAAQYLLDRLYEEQRYGPPGGHRGGGYVTRYRMTMDRIREVLQFERFKRFSEGWLTVREICERVETHYANPRVSVAKALLDFEHDWCESKKEGGKLYFRLRERSV